MISSDGLNRLRETTDALGGVTLYTYDPVGNRLTLTDPVGNTTTWVYDALDRLTQEANALGATRTFVYDAVGNLRQRTDRNGGVVEYDVDGLNRTTAERWLDGAGGTIHTLSFGYNADSELTAASDADSGISLGYDSLGRITAAGQTFTALGLSVVLSSGYDAMSNRTQLAATLGGVPDFVTDYGYDVLNRMTWIEQHPVATGGSPVEEKRIDLTYDAASQPDLITRYADLTATQLVARTDHTFDAASRLTGLSHAQGATTLAAYTWAYDDADRVTQFVSATDGTATYSYDNTDQVTGAAYTYQTNEAHTYDLNGNRTGGGYATAANNQTTSNGTYTYDYDAEGNRTKRTQIATGTVTEYTWDHRNRLTAITERASATGPITARFEYTYDVFNRRIGKALDTDGDGSIDQQEFFIQDGERAARDGAGDQIALVFADPDGSGPQPIALRSRLLYGPAVDQILAEEELSTVNPQLSTLYWPLADNQGTTRDAAEFDDATGITAIANHLVYDAFGNVTSQTNPAVKTASSYAGREFDEESGLYYYRARLYDAAIAQFVNEDPIGFEAGDANTRRYVRNSATNSVDPSGLDADGTLTPDNRTFWYIRSGGAVVLGMGARNRGHTQTVIGKVEGGTEVHFAFLSGIAEARPKDGAKIVLSEKLGGYDVSEDVLDRAAAGLGKYMGRLSDKGYTLTEDQYERSIAAFLKGAKDKIPLDRTLYLPFEQGTKERIAAWDRSHSELFVGLPLLEIRPANQVAELRPWYITEHDAHLAYVNEMGQTYGFGYAMAMQGGVMETAITLGGAPAGVSYDGSVAGQARPQMYASKGASRSLGRGQAALDYVPKQYRPGVARSFQGDPEAVTLTQDLIVYRHWGGAASETGSPWFSAKPYARPGNAHRYLALPAGNTAENVTAFKIPAGTTILRGNVASQAGNVPFGADAVGGGVQIYVPNPSVATPIPGGTKCKSTN